MLVFSEIEVERTSSSWIHLFTVISISREGDQNPPLPHHANPSIFVRLTDKKRGGQNQPSLREPSTAWRKKGTKVMGRPLSQVTSSPAYQADACGRVQTSICLMPGRWNVLFQSVTRTSVAEEISASWAAKVIRWSVVESLKQMEPLGREICVCCVPWNISREEKEPKGAVLQKQGPPDTGLKSPGRAGEVRKSTLCSKATSVASSLLSLKSAPPPAATPWWGGLGERIWEHHSDTAFVAQQHNSNSVTPANYYKTRGTNLDTFWDLVVNVNWVKPAGCRAVRMAGDCGKLESMCGAGHNDWREGPLPWLLPKPWGLATSKLRQLWPIFFHLCPYTHAVFI